MASSSDMFHKVGRSTATTLASPGYTTGDTSINVASTTNWPADTGVTFAIDEVDSNGLRVSGTYNVFRGKVAGGTQIDEVVYVGGDANRNYSAGATTRVYILVSSYRDNRFVDGLLTEHNQDGTHATNMTVNTNNATLTNPKVITGINDTNGNELLKVTATSSAVNELTLANAATGNAPVLSATGDDTNIGITLTPKGTGKVTIADSTNIGGAWATWTPTLTNMTLGNGTVTAKYIQIGKTVFFRFAFVFGSTSAMGSIPRFSLPVTAASHAGSLGSILIGTANAYDNGTNNFDCVAVLNSTTDAIIRVIQASSTNSLQANITSTNPMTWTTSDELHIIGQYEAA